jgi:uncharacterized repeat protein (TIGR01451 family)
VSWPDQTTVTVNPSGVDLGLGLTDRRSYALSGDPITYTLVISNSGSDTAIGAILTNTLPAVVTGVQWKCVATPGTDCPASTCVGLISAMVNLPGSGGLAFTINGQVAASAREKVVHMAGITQPDDVQLSNNHAVDSDILLYLRLFLPLIKR